jgi:ribose 5-phosphate isomerase B
VASATAALSSVVRANGEAIVANRVSGVRAAVWNQETARLGREHNDANGLALGARAIDQELALKIV